MSLFWMSRDDAELDDIIAARPRAGCRRVIERGDGLDGPAGIHVFVLRLDQTWRISAFRELTRAAAGT
jgi:hypothetical protein